MLIDVMGFNRAKRAKIKQATEYFAHQLMDPRMVRKLQIDIEHSPKLDVQGECVSEDMTKNPRWFTITLRDGKDDEDIIKTLAHEMVHVKQYAKNELGKEFAVGRGGKGIRIATRWKGEFWNAKKKEDPYWDCPWEIEAYGREVGLYQRWVDLYNQVNG